MSDTYEEFAPSWRVEVKTFRMLSTLMESTRLGFPVALITHPVDSGIGPDINYQEIHTDINQ